MRLNGEVDGAIESDNLTKGGLGPVYEVVDPDHSLIPPPIEAVL